MFGSNGRQLVENLHRYRNRENIANVAKGYWARTHSYQRTARSTWYTTYTCRSRREKVSNRHQTMYLTFSTNFH